MTFLVGQQGTGWTQLANLNQQSGGNGSYLAAAYTATASGSASNMYVACGSLVSAAYIKGAVYLGVGPGATLVATTTSVALVANTTLALPITANIVSGQSYTLIVGSSIDNATSGGYWNFITNSAGPANNCNQLTGAHLFPSGYTSSAASTFPAADVTGNGKEYIVWLDGNTAAAAVLLGQACF